MAKTHTTEVAYVIGGLYGNTFALDALQELARREQMITGIRPLLVFNGDQNWFNIDLDSFLRVNSEIMKACENGTAVVIAGNIEREISNVTDGAGCGCAYPEYVESEIVERSNTIIEQLRAVARSSAVPRAIMDWLQGLPMYTKLQVGNASVGVVHGDAHSLAGWSFAAEAMLPANPTLLHMLNISSEAHQFTPEEQLQQDFDQAGVDVFACTHTCLPFAQDFSFPLPASAQLGSRKAMIINNGSAGMPNFRGLPHGLITRISSHAPSPDLPAALYSSVVNGVYVSAEPLFYDSAGWQQHFESTHPAGSPANQSYLTRICDGPQYTIRQANRITEMGVL